MNFLKNFFSVWMLLFLAWVALTSLVFWACIHFGYSRFWIFVPLAGGLAWLLWPRKPNLNGRTSALLALALASGLLSCQSVPSTSRPAPAARRRPPKLPRLSNCFPHRSCVRIQLAGLAPSS